MGAYVICQDEQDWFLFVAKFWSLTSTLSQFQDTKIFSEPNFGHRRISLGYSCDLDHPPSSNQLFKWILEFFFYRYVYEGLESKTYSFIWCNFQTKKRLWHLLNIRKHLHLKNLERYFKSWSLPNNCVIRNNSVLKWTSFSIINALNGIRYLSDIDFKDQIQNSQKMVYLILGHPVYFYIYQIYESAILVI